MTTQVDAIVKTILSHLRASNQMELLSSVVDGLVHSSEYHNSKNRVTLTSASLLSVPELAQVHKYLKNSLGTAYDLVQITDPALVGGFTLQINDTLIDASVLGKINTVSHILTAKD